MNSDKALTNAMLELRQRVQMHFPRDLDPNVVQAWNGQPADAITVAVRMAFEKLPAGTTTPATQPPPIPPALRFLREVVLRARTARFVPGESYIVNTEPGRHVKIGFVDPDFTRDFGGMVEEPTADEVTLRQYVLDRPSAFAPAMQEVADAGFATKTTPGQLFFMLEKQPDGPKSKTGPLLADGSANLFEMVNFEGVSRLVNADWSDFLDGWRVYSHPVAPSSQWNAGSQLFSRNSRGNPGIQSS